MKSKPDFILVRNNRIRLSDIKTYGIGTEKIHEEQYHSNSDPNPLLIVGCIVVGYIYSKFKRRKEPQAAPKKNTVKYLYITTKTSNYKYYENEINIYKKIKELDYCFRA